MNIASDLLNGMHRIFSNIVCSIGKWGSFPPADPGKSSIIKNGESFPVISSLDGEYYYIDGDGIKKPVSGLKPGEFEWSGGGGLSATHAVWDNGCYASGEMYINADRLRIVDDNLNVVKVNYYILESNDPAVPIGDLFPDLPSGYEKVTCGVTVATINTEDGNPVSLENGDKVIIENQ